MLATINDKKLATDDGNGEVAYYEADVVTANDYYPFGMIMPGRKYAASELYRYGFNGKENDNEVKGEGNQQDYGMRIYDPRLVRFLSVDPLSKWYPFYTPYQFASNSPIIAVDVDGLESSKILNKAEQMLNTPYEFGGKKPAPELIGLLGSEEGKTFWSTLLLPGLRKISNYHPGHYKKGPGEVCTATDLYQQWAEVVKSVYQDFSTYSNKGSLGIDCSGFVNASYQEDKELLFDSKILRTGSSGQLAAFRKAEKEGKAYVHKDFNLLSEGDFIYKPDHVMIATGNVMVDESGKVISFETYEANSTDVGTVKMWRKVGKSYTIGHPFRTSDDGGGIKLEIPFIGTVTIPLPTSPSENAKQRTIDNQERKTIEVKKSKK